MQYAAVNGFAAHGGAKQITLATDKLVQQWCYNERLQMVGIRAGAEVTAGCVAGSNDRLRLAYSFGLTNNNGNVMSQGIWPLGRTQSCTYDAGGRLAAEYGGTATETGTRYLTQDHLGSTRLGIVLRARNGMPRRDWTFSRHAT